MEGCAEPTASSTRPCPQVTGSETGTGTRTGSETGSEAGRGSGSAAVAGAGTWSHGTAGRPSGAPGAVRVPKNPPFPPTRLPAHCTASIHAASPFPGFHQRDLTLPLAERAKEREHRRRDSLLDLDARSEVRPGFLSFWEGRLHSVLEVPFFLGRLSYLPPRSPPGLGREPRGDPWPQ